MSIALAACDLDRTVIYSAAALGIVGADTDAPDLLVAEVYGGAPISFLTAAAARTLAALAEAALLVPATTRTREQYARVRLPGRPHRYAVTGNGAHLLVDGIADPGWSAHMRAVLAAGCAPLAEVAARLAATCTDDLVRTRRVAEDAFAYAVLHRRDLLAPDALADLAAWCAPRGWGVSLQGRKVYCVPHPLTKSAAVQEVVRREGLDGFVAAGDSVLDAALLDAAAAGIRPAHGELHGLGWSRPHVAVTRASGVLAGEEIAAHLLAAVRARPE